MHASKITRGSKILQQENMIVGGVGVGVEVLTSHYMQLPSCEARKNWALYRKKGI